MLSNCFHVFIVSLWSTEMGQYKMAEAAFDVGGLLRHFSNLRETFTTVFGLHRIGKNAMDPICQRFMGQGFESLHGYVYMVKLVRNPSNDAASYTNQAIRRFPGIPAFFCMGPNGVGFITYCENAFYLLFPVLPGPVILSIVSANAAVDLDLNNEHELFYANLFNNILLPIAEYFQSEAYQNNARAILLNFLDARQGHDSYPKLCRKFSLYTLDPSFIADLETKFPRIPSQPSFPSVPVLPCLSYDDDTHTTYTNYYVAYYVSNIYFSMTNEGVILLVRGHDPHDQFGIYRHIL